MKSFLKSVLRSTLIYELITFGGLTLFLILAPLFGYLPYSDRPGPGWYGRFPALGWSEFWSSAGKMISIGAFFAVIALQFAVPCALFIVAADRFVHRRLLLYSAGVLLCAAVTFYLMPALGWYVALGAPAMWVGTVLGAVAGYLFVPQRAPVRAGA